MKTPEYQIGQRFFIPKTERWGYVTNIFYDFKNDEFYYEINHDRPSLKYHCYSAFELFNQQQAIEWNANKIKKELETLKKG